MLCKRYFLTFGKKNVFNERKAIKAYLYSAVKNKSLDYLKSNYSKKKSRIRLEDLHKLENDTFFLREVVIAEASEIMDAAIETLPIKCRKVIRLSSRGFSNPQIAEKLSISINTVKTQKKIAYNKLRVLLKKDIFILELFLTFFI